MSELYDKIVSERGRLENLMAKIPGFRGYVEGAERRKADRLLRNHIAGEIDQIVKRFNRLQNKMLDQGGLKYMSDSREVKSKIQAYRDDVQTAAPKYSGLFAEIKIGPEELDRIYSFDEAQMRYVDEINNQVDGLDNAIKTDVGIEDALDSIRDITDEAREAFDLRDNVILGLNEK